MVREGVTVLSLALCGCFNPGDGMLGETEGTDTASTSQTTTGGSTGATGPSTSASDSDPFTTGVCPDGGEGCPCGDGCDDGLTCVEGTCTNCGDGSVDFSEQCDGPVAGGQCDACLIACDVDCDGDPLTCEDLLTSADHCGACERSCLGAACADGFCEPIVLAENLGQPLGIAVDATHVYWADQATGGAGTGRILRHPLEPGDEPQVLAESQGNPERIALTATHVYWGNTGSGGIARVEKDGVNLEDFIVDAAAPKRLLTDEDNLYWVTFTAAGEVLRSPLSAPSIEVVTGGQGFPVGLAFDGTVLYWTARDDDAVRRADLAADPIVAEDVATEQEGAFAVAVSGGVVYWVNEGSQAGAFLDGSVRSVPTSGTQVTTLVEEERRPRELVVDGTHVYWISRVEQGAVRRATLDGQTVEDVVPDAALPGGIAQDGVAIYYTEQMAGRVLKVAK